MKRTLQIRINLLNTFLFLIIQMEERIHTLLMFVMVSVGNPVELIKSRIQTMNQMIINGTISRQYDGIADCFKTTKNIQGIKALWKGNSIALLRCYPNQKINNQVKNLVQKLLPTSIFSKIASGVCGGWAASGVLYPFDMARVCISTSVSCQKQAVRQLLAKISRQGLMSLYKGYSGSLLAIALYRGAYFGCFDTLKNKRQDQIFKWGSAYVSGLMGGLLVYPVQTIRKNVILGNRDVKQINVSKRIFQKEGMRGFFRGVSLVPIQSLTGAVILIYFDSQLLPSN